MKDTHWMTCDLMLRLGVLLADDETRERVFIALQECDSSFQALRLALWPDAVLEDEGTR